MTSLQAARDTLLETLRRMGISNEAVLEALRTVPREAFVPEHLESQAYDNKPLPIANNQTISQPYVVAYMTEVLDVSEDSKVLEIGTGSGYQAAVLAQLSRHVYTVERHRRLHDTSKALFQEMGWTQIHTRLGDGMEGWAEESPFDRIIVTAAASGEVPPALLQQLAPGGILVLPLGTTSAHQSLLKITRTLNDTFVQEVLLPVRFVPLLPGCPVDA